MMLQFFKNNRIDIQSWGVRKCFFHISIELIAFIVPLQEFPKEYHYIINNEIKLFVMHFNEFTILKTIYGI